ncbi:cryptochrome/photolyase family protein [Taibaiella soli]|uniref:Deoxyribodipyrimidine photo-lyase n=1 Tax=Taibaiella soli TaxID=1649169 RepID=A0A2W2B5L1_9BACT|nr:deoxyribodipyrimidine photo-lyase [Taibaiella soli]PZF71489.1 deoxyribodipyrimidine photo-lyase [Taibaiella soli]
MKVNIMWFRRDLRLKDNAALYHALKSDKPVVPVFIFDTEILDLLEDKKDRRVAFIHLAIEEMQTELEATGSTMHVLHGTPETCFNKLLKHYDIAAVFTNHDYELSAIERDKKIAHLLKEYDVAFHTYKDQVIFDKDEVVKDDGSPYTVYTPYSKRWKAKLNDLYLRPYPAKKYFHNFFQHAPIKIPSLHAMGFEASGEPFPPKRISKAILEQYKDQRDFPAVHGTSHLGLHLRFGTMSIRALAKHAQQQSETFLNELIWRDFYQCITYHFPHICKGQAFKREYDFIEWRYDEADFQKWCDGKTGYPIVDAGMRELNTTGFMHNRVRMIVASFLAKHLMIDWRWGEAYFAEKLLDFDFAANNGGWQWSAGCGCDAAPYFRVFNPTLQTEKFDKDLEYVRKWVPELDSLDYPQPMVEHSFARNRAIETYKKALKDR